MPVVVVSGGDRRTPSDLPHALLLLLLLFSLSLSLSLQVFHTRRVLSVSPPLRDRKVSRSFFVPIRQEPHSLRLRSAMAGFPGAKCVALFNYVAQDGEELTITKNEQLTVVSNEGTWWSVQNTKGHQGLVPSNYVKEIPQMQMPASSPFSNSSSASPHMGGGGRQAPNRPEMYQQTDLVMPANKPPALNIPAVAKFRYVSTREDELSLEKGDIVIILEKEADGWWRGRKENHIGWFPFNYVEETDAPPIEQPPASSPAPSEKPFICGVVALYSFNSGNPEELAFNKGDLMDIIDQPPDDPDWWEARKSDGTTGLIPRNYVEVIHDAQPVFGSKQGGGGGRTGGGGVVGPVASGMAPTPMGSKPLGGAGESLPAFVSEVWYHGKMARRDADRLLDGSAYGIFLVRESETKVRGRDVGGRGRGRVFYMYFALPRVSLITTMCRMMLICTK